MIELEKVIMHTDILIVGGGTAGCYAAIRIAEQSDSKVIIAEKANMKRSGCLAAGVNALNAYIVNGYKPEDYLEYVKKDANNLIREDLVLTMSERLNKVTHHMERLGLVILKDENGEYVARGNRNIKINGENIKPILADAVDSYKSIDVLNRVNIVDYIVKDKKVIGAYGFSIEENKYFIIYAKAVICATGGASGIYKPNNPGFSKHKMWYPPFNAGAGYAMGIRSGAEMTTFEMRFIALRCKDTIAPTGTIAQGVSAPQINGLGEYYDKNYGALTTANRVYSTVEENKQGRGPCFLKTKGIGEAAEDELLKAYLNMAPAQTLKWIERGIGPNSENVEIEGTEPYIVGGHTSSGYWIATNRETTIPGLYAAGDVAGGCPQKYVTGSLVEGEIAAESALEYIKSINQTEVDSNEINDKFSEITSYLTKQQSSYTVNQLEEAMQKVMDEYAGGISSNYGYNSTKLAIADERIKEINKLTDALQAKDTYELMKIHELKDRLLVARVVIAHLAARKETRWHSFQENLDYPELNDKEYFLYINSIMEDGNITIMKRDFVDRRQIYEHTHSSR
ncbi:MAG: fumarate reductase/succinate dehydrogenase flavoprotein domain protein [Anaerocolumna sp.]|jgi:adenylylsulfate reductase subunit A|nr:fumarate reductase/succinate dehydrogenase flavoprotein domain protein [Anaerocolumna sp.]